MIIYQYILYIYIDQIDSLMPCNGFGRQRITGFLWNMFAFKENNQNNVCVCDPVNMSRKGDTNF